jgi:hypothetical protein
VTGSGKITVNLVQSGHCRHHHQLSRVMMLASRRHGRRHI